LGTNEGGAIHFRTGDRPCPYLSPKKDPSRRSGASKNEFVEAVFSTTRIKSSEERGQKFFLRIIDCGLRGRLGQEIYSPPKEESFLKIVRVKKMGTGG